MKLPKTKNRYCGKCKKHSEHKIVEGKKKTRGSVHTLSFVSKKRIRARGRLGAGNNGKFSKPAISKWRMVGAKTSKKTDLRFQCSGCKKMSQQKEGFRAKKIEFKQ